MKLCKDCKKTLPAAYFYLRGDTGKPYGSCKKCRSQKGKNWRLQNPEVEAERHRVWLLKTRYNITISEYEKILSDQGGVCAICHEAPAGKTLHVDHDHGSGRIRGLLCYRCNVGIGYMKDYSDRLKRAAEYVDSKPPVEIEGFFFAQTRERGKLVQEVSGQNIWTLTGREYLARLMSYAAYGIGALADQPARNDRIRYIGMGVGTQPEVATVTKLNVPTPYDTTGTVFLAEIAIPTYPFQTSSTAFGTSVRYFREFVEGELSVTGPILLSEAGLFTDGSPGASFAPKTRSTAFSTAAGQAPAAYKSFEPLRKTQNFVLQVAWEIRF